MKKAPKVIAIYAVIIGFIVLAGAAWSAFANTPTQTHRTTTSSLKPKASRNLDLSPVAASGQFADFTYPAIFSVAPSNPVIPPVVAVYNYRYQSVPSWSLDIAIIRVPGGHLLDNDSYKMRTLKPEIYQASSLAVNGQSVPVMTDTTTGGFAKVAFLISGQYQATISLTSDDQRAMTDLETSLEQIVRSWHWKAD
jgi:hypothetical protein